MNWKIPKIWRGGDVWIIGGGPSLPRQFNIPNEIIQKVVNRELPPSSYSPYLSFLHDKHVIGINAAYLLGDWVDICFFGDINFFMTNQKGLAEFHGLKISCYPQLSRYNWVKYIPKDQKHKIGIGSVDTVSWNGNSGAAAISIAVHMGAKRIILLGFDMKLSEDKHQHWHDVYKRGVIEGKKAKGLPFSKHLKGFSEILKDLNKIGVEIINASPDSTIKEFPKISVKELIEKIELEKNPQPVLNTVDYVD